MWDGLYYFLANFHSLRQIPTARDTIINMKIKAFQMLKLAISKKRRINPRSNNTVNGIIGFWRLLYTILKYTNITHKINLRIRKNLELV